VKDSHTKKEENFRGALANKENTLEAPLTIKKPSKESPLKRTKKKLSAHTDNHFSFTQQPASTTVSNFLSQTLNTSSSDEFFLTTTTLSFSQPKQSLQQPDHAPSKHSGL